MFRLSGKHASDAAVLWLVARALLEYCVTEKLFYMVARVLVLFWMVARALFCSC